MATEPRAKAVEITLHAHAEVVDAPLQAGLLRCQLGRALAAHYDRGVAERHIDLRCAADVAAPDDFAAQLVDIPTGGGVRVFTDEVDVIEGEAGIGHDGFLSAGRGTGPAPAPERCGSVVPGGDARKREDRPLAAHRERLASKLKSQSSPA